MKKTILKVTVVLALSFTYSCGNQAKEKKDLEKIEKIEVVEESHEGKNTNLVLDDGKFWSANTETTTGVESMINLMSSFIEKDNVDAYSKLTESLKLEFAMIFQKCTMTGEAHNQLHNFLVPVKDLFVTLSSSDLKECQDSFGKLNIQLKKYKNFFQ